MNKTKEHKLFIVRQRPASHPQTKQQQLVRQAANECGIKKGITRDELIDKMINCIPEFFRKYKKG